MYLFLIEKLNFVHRRIMWVSLSLGDLRGVDLSCGG